MLYLAYQMQSDLMAPWRMAARTALDYLDAFAPWNDLPPVRTLGAAYEMFARAGLSHTRPPFGIDTVPVGQHQVAVREEVAFRTPFATLLHFAKDEVKANGTTAAQPRVLIVAPMSGHFATLLRDTVRTMLPEHDVFITDWHNARDVAPEHGAFGFDDYIAHVIQFLEAIGPGAHVMAVCQPCVQVLAAVALMAQDDNPAQPRSMTLMAGPIDTRANPTLVNALATEHPIEWFERTLISTVPYRFAGAGRRVYPGFMQLTAFVAMNPDRHIKAHIDMFEALATGDTDKSRTLKTFYDEYFAVLDLTAEFYLETVQKVFQDTLLARGELFYRGRRVDPGVIKKTALLTVEGERDDICAVGQTVAAQDLCTGLKPFLKRHYLQPGVGHYGIFAGRRWESQIYPNVRNLILASE